MFLSKVNTHQRGDTKMAQGILPFKYELERSEAGMMALAGLPLYLDLAKVVGPDRFNGTCGFEIRDRGGRMGK
jgi:hypothetical protein